MTMGNFKNRRFSLYKLQAYGANGGKAAPIHNLDLKWTCVISFTSRPPYPARECLDTNLVGHWVGPKDGTEV